MRLTSQQSERLFRGNPGRTKRRPKESFSDRNVAVLIGPEATGLAIFCALGLLLTATFSLLVPNFAAAAASLQPLF